MCRIVVRMATRTVKTESPYKLQAIDRAFSVLDVLAESPDALSLAQLTATLKLHKSTVHRFVMVLERHRMVERTADGNYRLGLRLYDLGSRAVQQIDLRERVQPHLRRLAAETGETAHLCVLEKTVVVYLDKIAPNRGVCMTSRIGTSNPVYCTSVGKAILACLPEDEVLSEILPKLHYVRLTPKTIMSHEAFMKELQRTRRRGYAMDDEEIEAGVRCVGAAILGAEARPVAALSVSGPTFRITIQKVPVIAAQLKECVDRIGRELGFAPARGTVNTGLRNGHARS